MCGARSPAGAESEKRPCASLLVLPTSCMPCDSERSVTSSPAEGLPVVALVTVPVMFWAAAKEVSKSRHRKNPGAKAHFKIEPFSAGLKSSSPLLKQGAPTENLSLPLFPLPTHGTPTENLFLTRGLRWRDALCRAAPPHVPSQGSPSRQEWRLLRLPARHAAPRNRTRSTCRPCARS